MIYVSDTHSLIWFLTNDSKLGKEALKIFLDADDGKVTIVIPTIVLAEIAYIIENKGYSKINFTSFLDGLEHSSNYIITSLDIDIIKDMQKYT